MAANKNKVDLIHDQMPRFFKTRTNPNWNALITALGESDQELAELIEEVRKQFFIKTASRPYLDRLGANFKVSRPRFIGMDDPTFRNYIPILSYQPKQVKLVLDLLLDVFFFKETTTAFTQSLQPETYDITDGWELLYTVDQTKLERIQFNADEFISLSAATAEEVVAAINRQAQFSFAVVYDDRIKKQKFIRLFSNTIGSKGSIQITGGRADMSLQFRGFNLDAGSETNTVWTVTKIGDTVTFQHTGGTSPNLDKLEIGDIVIISINGNEGSFVIQSIDLNNNSFTFINLFATPGVYNHSVLPTDELVRFIKPEKMVVYLNNSRSVVWEVSPGEIIVEMPATPPVVKRSLIGSAHLNGMVARVTDTPTQNSLEIENASDWPVAGTFVLQTQNEIQTHILTGSEDVVLTKELNTRFNNALTFSYTSKTGNVLNGISPNLPIVADLYENNIVSATRSSNIITIVTSTAHNYEVGEAVRIQGVAPDALNDINGTFIILSTPTSTSFTYMSVGADGVSAGGESRVERIGMSNDGSLIYLTTAQMNTGIYGPYMWSPDAAYVISSLTSKIQSEIKAGNNVRTLPIEAVNNIPNQEGFVVFDFGTEFEEGPVRYLYKPTTGTLQLDPAYVFKQNHEVGSSITVIRRRGAHVMSGLGSEYPAYITDPAVARRTLQELMKQVKSAGIFLEFLVRYPEQLYSTLDVYDSGREGLWPIGDQ